VDLNDLITTSCCAEARFHIVIVKASSSKLNGGRREDDLGGFGDRSQVRPYSGQKPGFERSSVVNRNNQSQLCTRNKETKIA